MPFPSSYILTKAHYLSHSFVAVPFLWVEKNLEKDHGDITQNPTGVKITLLNQISQSVVGVVKALAVLERGI